MHFTWAFRVDVADPANQKELLERGDRGAIGVRLPTQHVDRRVREIALGGANRRREQRRRRCRVPAVGGDSPFVLRSERAG